MVSFELGVQNDIYKCNTNLCIIDQLCLKNLEFTLSTHTTHTVGRLLDLHGDSASGKGGTDTFEPPVLESV